ncbi:SCP2 sterol-binding domain-containing protein [Streptomyces sp. URMC 125]|uniref:SCP2 sterol-binding domain-containing protein n=1 Tax=Streptomyces sp. URMC 125 TaxID=3423419 RepID=UPI003F1ADC31
MDDGAGGGAAGLEDLDPASACPEEFSRIVRDLSTREIRELMRGDRRRRVLGEVFRRMERQFRPERAGPLDALVRWEVTGESEVVHEVAVAGGACTVREGRSGADPHVTPTTGDAEFLRLASGNAGPVTMFTTRRLRIAGDLGLAAGPARYFGVPRA